MVDRDPRPKVGAPGYAGAGGDARIRISDLGFGV